LINFIGVLAVLNFVQSNTSRHGKENGR